MNLPGGFTIDALMDLLPKEKFPDRIELNSCSLHFLTRGLTAAMRILSSTGNRTIGGIPFLLDENLLDGEVHFKELCDEDGIRYFRTYMIFNLVTAPEAQR